MITSTTTTSVNVSWDAIDCIERNGVITDYAVVLQEQGGARIPGEVVDQTFSAEHLRPFTTYLFRVAGVNSIGTGPFITITIHTNEDCKLTIDAQRCIRNCSNKGITIASVVKVILIKTNRNHCR